MRDAALRSVVLSVVCWELKQKAGATAALFKYSPNLQERKKNVFVRRTISDKSLVGWKYAAWTASPYSFSRTSQYTAKLG